jgi:hypothetical protein
MRIVANNGVHDYNGMQLDYAYFESASNPPSPTDPPVKPYSDTPPTPPPGYVSPVSLYGDLYVNGANIKSSVTGENVQLKFVAVMSPKWFPVIENNTVYNLAYTENVDGIRLAMYAEWGTYDDPHMQSYLQSKTLEMINECIDAGIYLEISYHTHATDFQINGDAYNLEMDFYNWLLQQPVVAAKPANLVFGIINEIADAGISWDTAKPYAQAFVNLIRNEGYDNIILCGTPYWCQRPQDLIGNVLTGNNIVYTLHIYAASHSISEATSNIIACYNAGIALWGNEISPGHYDWHNNSYSATNFNTLVYELETRDLPWSVWGFHKKPEPLSVFTEEAQYYGPWTDNDFTQYGNYVRDKLSEPWAGGDPTPTSTATATPSPTPTGVTPTPTPTGGDGCTCVNGCESTTNISPDFVYDGAGEYCWETDDLGNYINSWNLEHLEINGIDYTNVWSNNFPEKIDGKYYIYYKGNYGWSHFEDKRW